MAADVLYAQYHGQAFGGALLVFKDYNSPCNLTGNEGVVDRFTVPKTIFYMFRQKWTGIAPDYPKAVTATTVPAYKRYAGAAVRERG